MEIASKSVMQWLLLVIFISYLPHFVYGPTWLTIVIIILLSYRFAANRFNYPLPTSVINFILIAICLGLLFWHYQSLQASGFYIGFLLLFCALKSLEGRTIRDLRVLILCNFYIILTALLLYQFLWIFIYLIVAILCNVMFMAKLTAQKIDFKGFGKSFLKQFLWALPFSLLLFYLFPRLSHPLWRVPLLAQPKTGFSEQMTLKSLSSMVDDETTAMRIVFYKNFKADFYWRGLVLSSYNGVRWKASLYDNKPLTLPLLNDNGTPSYEVLLEPHQKKWLFYQDNPIAAEPSLVYSPAVGLTQVDYSAVYQRFNYRILDKMASYQAISKTSYQRNTYLPSHGNPRLKLWAKQQFASVHNNIPLLLSIIARRINVEPYWYSLNTHDDAEKTDLLDHFWFDTKRGYCEYYAGAVAVILRAAGIPTRIVVGYHGGRWNPIAQYLLVQQNDAHAWLEYWQENLGWQRLDPVTFIAANRIDPLIKQRKATELNQNWRDAGATLPWFSRLTFMLDSAQFFWERWLLFYNQDTQQTLLQKIDKGRWDEMLLLQLFIAMTLLIPLIAAVGYFVRYHQKEAPLLLLYHRLQQEMRRLNINTKPPATFTKQLEELALKQPKLTTVAKEYARKYDNIRLKKENNADNIYLLLKSLLKKLK